MPMEEVVLVVVILVITFGIIWLVMRSIGGLTGRMKNGLPARAVIQSIAETGTTISAPSVGPEAPVYSIILQVTPPSGPAYAATTKQAIPRIFVPMILPGAQVAVLIDPADPQHVDIDFQNFSTTPKAIGDVLASASGGDSTSSAAELVREVRSGEMPTTVGSAAALLASGTRGTATVQTAMPLGKRVRDLNPAADPATLDDPMWLFTLQVEVPGEAPFPAVFGHRVPAYVAGQVAPGMRLKVAVDMADRNQEVAIDWQGSQEMTAAAPGAGSAAGA